MKFQKNISYFILTLVLVVGTIIGYNSLNPSKPNYTDNSKTNVNNQMEHILNISKEPHTIFEANKEAQDEVRDYLISQLEKFGVNTKTYKYEGIHLENHEAYGEDATEYVDLENIYGELKGKSDSYILLATHYDSAGAKEGRYSQKEGSLGSADAGYALSTILETLRVIKESNVQLENGIKILFTDGEECGLLGAKEAVKEKEIFQGVNYVINIEARGTSGPAIMFETSQNNNAVMELYDFAEAPFSYSITPEIYRVLPNGTDFTVFLENGLNGINISVLDGLEHYHTPDDNPENLSDKSMQHYGDQVLPIVKEFVSNEKYSDPDALKGTDDSIFFILGNVFIKYSKTINYLLLLLIFVAIVFLHKKFNIEKISKVFKFTGINLIFILVVAICSYGISRLMAIINNRPFSLTYLPLIKYENILVLSTIAISIISYILVIKKFSYKFKEKNEFILGSLVLLLILSIILTFTLPGASYITVLPALLISIFTCIKEVFEYNKNISFIILIPVFIITLLYVPTIYLFNCSLTFGALCVTMIFVMIGVISLFSGVVSIKDIIKVDNKMFYKI